MVAGIVTKDKGETKEAGRKIAFPGDGTTLMPRTNHPFYIVTPPFTRISAGITTLHLLCHYLNLLGECAYIIQYPPDRTKIGGLPSYASLQSQKEVPGGMLAPLITQDILDFYDERGIVPIVIYPEVFDNPFNACFFARYILNYQGNLSRKYKQRENFAFAYTEILAQHSTKAYPNHPQVVDVLFVPTCDLEFWSAKGASEKREGTCYYAGKMKDFHRTNPENIPSGSIEILRSLEMSRVQIRELFWRSEAFYCYEDTALAIEAQLCGCPAVFVPNEHFTGLPLASVEMGPSGSCVANESGGLDRARGSIRNVEAIIRSNIALVPLRIAALASRLKSLVAKQEYQGAIDYPFEPRMVVFMKKNRDR